MKKKTNLRNARPANPCRCAWRRVAWPERGRGRPVRNPRRKARSAAASTAALKVAARERNGSYRQGLYTREAIAERKAMRALIRSFREDARAALSTSTQPRVSDPRETVPEAHGLPLPRLRSGCALDDALRIVAKGREPP
jgi:hypothetical protein